MNMSAYTQRGSPSNLSLNGAQACLIRSPTCMLVTSLDWHTHGSAMATEDAMPVSKEVADTGGWCGVILTWRARD